MTPPLLFHSLPIFTTSAVCPATPNRRKTCPEEGSDPWRWAATHQRGWMRSPSNRSNPQAMRRYVLPTNILVIIPLLRDESDPRKELTGDRTIRLTRPLRGKRPRSPTSRLHPKQGGSIRSHPYGTRSRLWVDGASLVSAFVKTRCALVRKY